MEKYEQKEDVSLICLKAASFPEGIMDAFNKLQESLPNCSERTWYGISKPNEKGEIIYKAAVTELSDMEAEKTGFESFTVTKGIYLTEEIKDWRKNMQMIGETFNKLLQDPELDMESSCIERYTADDEILCMVKLKQLNNPA